MLTFETPTDAFEYYYDHIEEFWEDYAWTKALFNVWFYVKDSTQRIITTPWRKFSTKYAEREWEWYLSEDKSVEQIWKFAPIWLRHANERWEVNSNYWNQVMRDWQWEYVREKLKQKDSRHWVLTIYDGKEHSEYEKDTPCTIAIHFQVIKWELCMTVMMRSNDIWYGFGNDQYCFSKFQEKMAWELWLPIWWYYHFASNLHLYADQQWKKDA